MRVEIGMRLGRRRHGEPGAGADASDAESGESRRFTLLIVFMLSELMLAPLAEETAVGLFVARAIGLGVLCAALLAVGLRRTSLIIFVPCLAAVVANQVSGAPALLPIAVAARLMCLTYAGGVLLWKVLHDRVVSWDTIAAAACVYMLLGFAWAHLDMLLEWFRPGSFTVPDGFLVAGQPGPALTYFSFATLTSVGYGEIHPNDPGAGGVCVSETIVGQLYMAILIARLVGLRSARG